MYVKLGTISAGTHFLNCVHIRRSQTIAAIFWGFLSFFIWRSYIWCSENMELYCNSMLKSRYWSLSMLLFLLSYTCFFKVRKHILYFYFYMRAGWNLSLTNLIKFQHFIKYRAAFSNHLKSICSCLICAELQLYFLNWELSKNPCKNFNRKTLRGYFWFKNCA